MNYLDIDWSRRGGLGAEPDPQLGQVGPAPPQQQEQDDLTSSWARSVLRRLNNRSKMTWPPAGPGRSCAASTTGTRWSDPQLRQVSPEPPPPQQEQDDLTPSWPGQSCSPSTTGTRWSDPQLHQVIPAPPQQQEQDDLTPSYARSSLRRLNNRNKMIWPPAGPGQSCAAASTTGTRWSDPQLRQVSHAPPQQQEQNYYHYNYLCDKHHPEKAGMMFPMQAQD